MKYIAVLDTDEIKDFEFFEDGAGKYLRAIDANAKNGEWIYLPFKPLEQEPFINKPCVSSGVCEHDKNVVLDKIRAEIETWHKEGTNWSDIRLMEIENIIDKYKAESEKYENWIN